MPPRNLLPRLDGGNVGVSSVGAWSVLNAPGELARLDLGSRDDDIRTRIQSIPSPWARLLLFRLALRDPKHPARRLVENELLDAFQFIWSRGERPNAPLTYQQVRLRDLLSIAERLGSERCEWWARSLVELLPARRDGDPAFETITIVSAGGHPILATSPFTALFTAEDAGLVPRDVTGANFRYAVGDDPHPLSQRSFSFQRYVAQVLLPQLETQEGLEHHDTDASALQSDLKRWLDEEVRQARRAAGSASSAQLDRPGNWRDAAASLGLEEVADLTGGLRLFARKAGADMQDSEWVLRSSRSRGSLPLVLQPSAFNGRYYPGGAPVSLPPNLESLDAATLPQTATRYPWVYPEKHWFADQILILAEPLEASNVLGFKNFKTLYNGDKQYLKKPQFTLPLKREVLDFFTPEELEDRLSIEVQPSGHVDISLRVPIGSQGRELLVKRHYDESAFFHGVTGPALTMWPRFNAPVWKDYMLFRRDENPSVAQFITVHGVAGSAQLAENSERRNDQASVSSFSQAPEAIEFESQITGGAKPQQLGLVIPKYRRAQPAGPMRWQVGVDFGTSNTVVSIKKVADSAPIVLEAKDMTLPLTTSSADTLSLLDAYFMPHDLAPKPFGTAVVAFDQLRTLNFHEEHLGVRVNVPFSGHVQSDERNRVSGDLKWSNEASTRFLTAAFLRHVLAVVLSQALENGVDPRNVEVVWSYPRAFSPGQVNQLSTMWEQVREYLNERFGGIGSIKQGIDESRAVLQFFLNDRRITTAGDVNVIIDIGGGTSDIAIYGHGKTLALDSVMLGGRNLTGQRDFAGAADGQRNAFVARFVDWAQRNSLTDYPIEREAVLKYLRDGQDHLAFTYLLQSRWFERNGKAFVADDAAHRFQSMVLYLFGSLAYYVGLSLRGLAQQDSQRDYAPAALVLAGNGSQYLRWLTDLSRSGDITAFSNLLGRLILTGMNRNDGAALPRVDLTEKPKREVALGLVAQTDIRGNHDGESVRASIAGEAFSAKVGDRRADRAFAVTDQVDGVDIITPDQVANLQWQDSEMEIERFHAALSAEVERLVAYGPQWRANAEAIRRALAELQRREIQQVTKARLQLVSSSMGGFHGSLFTAEVAAVAARLQDSFFGASVPSSPHAMGAVR